jgi:hypothetical protein
MMSSAATFCESQYFPTHHSSEISPIPPIRPEQDHYRPINASRPPTFHMSLHPFSALEKQNNDNSPIAPAKPSKPAVIPRSMSVCSLECRRHHNNVCCPPTTRKTVLFSCVFVWAEMVKMRKVIWGLCCNHSGECPSPRSPRLPKVDLPWITKGS